MAKTGQRSGYSDRVFDVIPPDLRSPPSLLAKQAIIHSFSPRVSVETSDGAEQAAHGLGFRSLLDLLSSFEGVLSSGDNCDSDGTGLVVRFTGPLGVQLAQQKPQNAFSSVELYSMDKYVENVTDQLSAVDGRIEESQWFKKKKGSERPACEDQSQIYLNSLRKALCTDTIAPFEYFGHPLVQIFACSADEDSRHVVQQYLQWKDSKLIPDWVDQTSIVPLFLIVADTDRPDDLTKGQKLQERIKVAVSQKAIMVPFSFGTKGDEVTLYSSPYASVDSASVSRNCWYPVTQNFYNAWMRQIQNVIYKVMVPFMQKRMKYWNEEVVAPRKSLTGRIGRLWGSSSKKSFFSFGSSSSSSQEKEESSETSRSYNASAGFYQSRCPEAVIRRLGDWYFMLRDYKSAYSTYELLKKDYLNDKAYSYLSSLQEFMVISLVLGSSGKLNPVPPVEGNAAANTVGSIGTVRGNGISIKIVKDVVTPLVDSSFYSYQSRCNLKTYSVRLVLLVAELYFVLGQSAANYPDYIGTVSPSTYLGESVRLFEKLIDSRLIDSVSAGIYMERVAYVFSSYSDPPPAQPPLSGQPYYETENPEKLETPDDDLFGLSRNRKSVLWMLLAARTLRQSKVQTGLMMWCVERELYKQGLSKEGPEQLAWPFRNGLLKELTAND